MRILSSIILPSTTLMAALDPEIAGGSTIGPQVVGDHPIWNEAIFLQELAHQFQRSVLEMVYPPPDRFVGDRDPTMIRGSGYRPTLLTFGIILGATGTVAALFLRSPEPEEVPTSAAIEATSYGIGPREMLRTPIFWLMFSLMTMMSTGGLMVTSNFATFARDFGVSDALVLGVAALPLALTFDRLTNGFTRPFFGWVSDRIGRENTMGFAFGLEACAIALLLLFRQEPALFVLLSGIVCFGWGEIFSLFPSTLTDTFGARHATTNYGFLYMAQGVGSILGGPLAALLRDASGGWAPVFVLAIALDVVAALLALYLLKPMRTAYCKALPGSFAEGCE
jgi:predicted MFS family arabinose efflux permease